MPDQVQETAKRMIARYGRDRALEYASGYASGVYFDQTAQARAHWLAVYEAILTINRRFSGLTRPTAKE